MYSIFPTSKRAFLFTGKICPPVLDRLMEQTRYLPSKYASIWRNEPIEYIDKLTSAGFVILYNDVQSCYPQLDTANRGIQYLKKKGYSYVLRTRFDILTPDYLRYMDLIDPTRITVIMGIHTNLVYFLDTSEFCLIIYIKVLNDTHGS
jgi:hypothetical protein